MYHLFSCLTIYTYIPKQTQHTYINRKQKSKGSVFQLTSQASDELFSQHGERDLLGQKSVKLQ